MLKCFIFIDVNFVTISSDFPNKCFIFLFLGFFYIHGSAYYWFIFGRTTHLGTIVNKQLRENEGFIFTRPKYVNERSKLSSTVIREEILSIRTYEIKLTLPVRILRFKLHGSLATCLRKSFKMFYWFWSSSVIRTYRIYSFLRRWRQFVRSVSSWILYIHV